MYAHNHSVVHIHKLPSYHHHLYVGIALDNRRKDRVVGGSPTADVRNCI